MSSRNSRRASQRRNRQTGPSKMFLAGAGLFTIAGVVMQAYALRGMDRFAEREKPVEYPEIRLSQNESCPEGAVELQRTLATEEVPLDLHEQVRREQIHWLFTMIDGKEYVLYCQLEPVTLND